MQKLLLKKFHVYSKQVLFYNITISLCVDNKYLKLFCRKENEKEISVVMEIIQKNFQNLLRNFRVLSSTDVGYKPVFSINTNNKIIPIASEKNVFMFLDAGLRSKICDKFKKFVSVIVRGFCCILELIGLGFSVAISNNILRFNIGYNHSIFLIVPSNILVKVKRKSLYCFSYCFFALKNFVVDIKNLRQLSPFKLKGIKLKNELYIKKD
jgi:ribosomal protein L6P/L9E